MKFVMARNRTIVSMCGLSVRFAKGELTHVPPAMYEEVMAAGGVPEEEIDRDPVVPGGVVEPVDPSERQAALIAAMETLALRGKREDFTSGGAPHAKALSQLLGWNVQNKERDTAWTALKNKED